MMRDERGSAAILVVVLLPLLFTIVTGVVQLRAGKSVAPQFVAVWKSPVVAGTETAIGKLPVLKRVTF